MSSKLPFPLHKLIYFRYFSTAEDLLLQILPEGKSLNLNKGQEGDSGMC